MRRRTVDRSTTGCGVPEVTTSLRRYPKGSDLPTINVPVPHRRLAAVVVLAATLAGPASLAGPVSPASAKPAKVKRTSPHTKPKLYAFESGRKVGFAP